MPTYVYECKSCEKSFEVEQRITENPLTDCDCGGTLRRVIQPVGIAFKGSGFYVNDSTAKPAETKSETKTEAKPAETPAPAPAPAETKSDTF
jgi:putative FmdB family regulatory protein